MRLFSTPLRRRYAGVLADYAIVAALVAILSIGVILTVGDRVRCILAQTGQAAGLSTSLEPCGDPGQGTPPGDGPGQEEAGEPPVFADDGDLPEGTVGLGYTYQILATSPDGSQITFEQAGGVLPAGLALARSGLLQGVPAEGGFFTVQIRAIDAAGRSRVQQRTLFVNAPPVIDAPTVAERVLPLGVASTLQIRAADLEGDAITFSLLLAPDWASIDPTTGLISFFPPEDLDLTQPALSLIVQATDARGASAQRSFAMNPTADPAWITPEGLLPAALIGETYDFRLKALSARALTYTIISGALPGPPGAMALIPGTGRLVGVLTADADATFTVRASDGTRFADRTFRLATTRPPVWVTTQADVPRLQVGVPFSIQLRAVDPDGDPVSYAFAPGHWNRLGFAGVSFDPLLGRISGVPTRSFGPQAYRFIARDNRGGESDELVLVLTTEEPPVWTTERLVFVLDEPRSFPLEARAFQGRALVFSAPSGSLPTGLSLSAAGVVSGTPRVPGIFQVPVTATDRVGATAERTIEIVVGRRPVFVTDATLPAVVAGETTDLQIQAVDPDGDAISYALTIGGGPQAQIRADGTLTLSPEADRTTPFILRVVATDATGLSAERTFQAPVIARPVWNTGSVLPGYLPGAPYETILAASVPSGGVVSYTADPAQALPAWLSLDPTSGRLSGIAPAEGTFSFSVVATGPFGLSATRTFTLGRNLPPVWMTPADLGVFTAPAYAYIALVAIDTDPVSYSLAPGSAWPPGMIAEIRAADVLLRGYPAPGLHTFTLRASDGITPSVERTFTIVGNRAPLIGLAALPDVPADTPFGINLEASDPDGDPLTFSVLGALPAGVSLDADGVLRGMLVTGAPPVFFSAVVQDGRGGQAQRAFVLRLESGTSGDPTVPPPVWRTAVLPPAVPGTGYDVQLQATPGLAGLTLTFEAVEGLPAGLSLSAAGRLSGVIPIGHAGPRQPTVVLRVVQRDPLTNDPKGPAVDRVFPLLVNGAPEILVAPPATLPMATGGQAYGPLSWTASDPDGDLLTWTLVGAPPGWTLDVAGNTATLSTTPNPEGPGSAAFTIRVTDPFGGQATRTHTLAINLPPRWIPGATLPGFVAGTPYSAPLPATDPEGGPLTFLRTSGVLPAGLSLTDDGRLAGVPTPGGPATFTLRAIDAHGASTDATFTVGPDGGPPAWTTPAGTLGIALVGAPFSTALLAVDPDGGAVSYRVVDGQIPPGLSLGANGAISGVPAPGPGALYEFTVEATDSSGLVSLPRIFSITTNNAPVWPTESGQTLAAAAVQLVSSENPLEIVLQAIDPDGEALTYVLAAGQLPPGVDLNPSTGELTGIPVAGVYNFSIRATDPFGASATVALTMTARVFNEAPEWQTETNLEGAEPGEEFERFLLASDPEGDTPLVWTLAPGSSLPPGLTLGPFDGRLAGAVATAGSYAFSVRVEDTFGAAATRLFRIEIRPRPVWITAEGPLPQPTNGGIFYSQTLVATGSSPISYTIVSGELPAGISLATKGHLSGATTAPAGTTSTFTVRATDAFGRTADRTFSLRVNDRPRFDLAAPTTLGPFPLGQPIDIALPVLDADTDQTLTCTQISSAPIRLPPGTSMGPGCRITGVPTATYNDQGRWQVSDGIATAETPRVFRIQVFDPNASVTPFVFNDLRYAETSTGPQNSGIHTLQGTVETTVDLTVRLTGPRAGVQIWLNGSNRGTLPIGGGTITASAPVRIGQTIQIRAVPNPWIATTREEFDAADEYHIEILNPFGQVLYQTTLFAYAPPRRLQPGPFSFATIAPVGTAQTASTSVPIVSGMNDQVRISAVGPGPFTLRAAVGGNSTCTNNANTPFASAALGDGRHEAIAMIGTRGQNSTTQVRLCLSDLQAEPSFGGRRTWTVTFQDPQDGRLLQSAEVVLDTVARDNVPSFGRHTVNQNLAATSFNQILRTDITSPTNVSEGRYLTRITGFNVPLRLEVQGPRNAQIKAFNSLTNNFRNNTCATASAQQSGEALEPNPTYVVGTTRTDAGTNTSWICVNVLAPDALGRVDTYTLRAVDPDTGETVLNTTFTAIGPVRDVTPTFSNGTGNATWRLLNTTNVLPNKTLTPNVLTDVSSFNVPIAFRLTAPPGASMEIRIVAAGGNCNSAALATLLAPPGGRVTSPALGSSGTPQTLRVCVRSVSLGFAFGAEHVFELATLDPLSGVVTGAVYGRATTVTRDPVPTVSSIPANITGMTFGLPHPTVPARSNNYNTAVVVNGFNVGLSGVFHGPSPFRLFSGTSSICSSSSNLDRGVSSFNPETGRHEITVPYVPNAVSPGVGRGVGDDFAANSYAYCILPLAAPISSTVEYYGVELRDPADGTLVFASTPGGAGSYTYTGVAFSHSLTGFSGSDSRSALPGDLAPVRQINFTGIIMPTRFEAEMTGPGTISLWMIRSSSDCSAYIPTVTNRDQPTGVTTITAATPHVRWHIPSGTESANTPHRACIYYTGGDQPGTGQASFVFRNPVDNSEIGRFTLTTETLN